MDLLQQIKDLRSKIANSSLVDGGDPFYLYFNKTKVDERYFYWWCCALSGLEDLDKTDWDPIMFEIARTCYTEVEKVSIRFEECKFFKFFILLFYYPKWTEFKVLDNYCPSREYSNFKIPKKRSVSKETFVLRFETKRKLRKPAFVRGYRDKGSASSISVRAVRAANLAGSDRDPNYLEFPDPKPSRKVPRQRYRDFDQHRRNKALRAQFPNPTET